MIMAATDNTQALTQMTKNNNDSADTFLASSTTNSTTSLRNESNSVESNVMQKDHRLIRHFDLADEADYSYVLGYN